MNNSILLVNLPLAPSHSYENRGAIFPSTALLLLGSILKREGYEVVFIDGAYSSDYLQQIRDKLSDPYTNFIFVGMSIMTTQVPFALTTSACIREIAPHLPIVVGGPHPTLFPEQMAEHPAFDIVVVNEGTKALIKLAATLVSKQSIHNVTGLYFKDKGGTTRNTGEGEPDDIGTFPDIDFSLLEIDRYISGKNSVYKREFPHFDGEFRPVPILTALGCPYRCRFCINVILKRKYRYLPAEEIICRIKKCKRDLNANTFIFMDEDFFIHRKRALSFVELAEKENLHFNWRMWCRVDHFKPGFLDRRLLERLARIGHGSLVMGGESANQKVLDSLEKGITPDQVLHSLRELQGLPINPRYSFIVGLENESMEQIRQTYAFTLELQDLRHDVDIAGPFLFRLYPGSPIYDNMSKNYNLEIPDKLESWGDFLKNDENNFTGRPWVPAEFLNLHNKISFYHQWAMYKYRSWTGLHRWVAGNILSHLAAFRLRNFFFSFPFEYWLLNQNRK